MLKIPLKKRYFFLKKHREIKKVSNGNKVCGVELIWMTVIKFEKLTEKCELWYDTITESTLQNLHKFPINPIQAKLTTVEGFDN